MSEPGVFKPLPGCSFIRAKASHQTQIGRKCAAAEDSSGLYPRLRSSQLVQRGSAAGLCVAGTTCQDIPREKEYPEFVCTGTHNNSDLISAPSNRKCSPVRSRLLHKRDLRVIRFLKNRLRQRGPIRCVTLARDLIEFKKPRGRNKCARFQLVPRENKIQLPITQPL